MQNEIEIFYSDAPIDNETREKANKIRSLIEEKHIEIWVNDYLVCIIEDNKVIA